MSKQDLKTIVQTAAQEQKPTILTGGNGMTHRLNRDVFLVIQDGIAQLLDFNRGQFYGLDPIATLMVSLVLEHSPEEAVAQISRAYDVAFDDVQRDLTGLLQNLKRKKLLVSTDKQPNPSLQWIRPWVDRVSRLLGTACLLPFKAVSSMLENLLNNQPRGTSRFFVAPSRRTVDLLLSLSWIGFRLLGWSRTLSWWQCWHHPIDAPEASVREEVIQTVDRVVRSSAARKLFLPIACKERALVGYHLLRAFYGLPASLVVGIERNPFQLHAWVECDGLVVTDDPAHCQPFTPVVRYS
jgi:hypothetical protein